MIVLLFCELIVLCWESIGMYALVVNVALVVKMCAFVVSECFCCGIVVLVTNVALVVVCVPVWWF